MTEKTYTSAKVGWTITLPGPKWKTLAESELIKMNEKGQALVEEAINQKIDHRVVENLINLKKDAFNYFFASIERYDTSADNSYDRMLVAVHETIKAAYASKNIPAEYEIGATRIDGLMLDRYIITLGSKHQKKKILHQELYTCLINNYVLSITLMYNNERDRETLHNILQSSNFTMNSNS